MRPVRAYTTVLHGYVRAELSPCGHEARVRFKFYRTSGLPEDQREKTFRFGWTGTAFLRPPNAGAMLEPILVNLERLLRAELAN